MKQCLRWETDPADVEYTVDSYRTHSFPDMLDKEAEVVHFWAAPQSDTPKVSEGLIRALSARMSLEELRMLPPVVFVGMRRAISKSGTVSLYPSELMIPLVRDALLEDRIYGYNSDGRHCRVSVEDVVSVEASLVLWDLGLLAGGQDWSNSVFKEATTVPNKMYNDKRVRPGRDVVVACDEYGVVREDGDRVPYAGLSAASARTSGSRAGEAADGHV
jgi:hypothetical protein